MTHTHPFNGPFSRIIRVSRYQKGNTNLDFCEAKDSEWQWHQLGRMQVCTSLQTDNHASTPPLSFYRPDALPAAQPTASTHWRRYHMRWWNKAVDNLHSRCVCLDRCAEPPRETGACYDYVMKYSYVTETGDCEAFYYGGCEGNDNRFESREECEATCTTASPPPPADQLSGL